jgi:Universal stress protein family.
VASLQFLEAAGLSASRSNRCVAILRQGDAPVKIDGANMKCILVPIDFSDVTPPVIDLARQLAKALSAEIHLVHVKELTAAQHRAHSATAWRGCLSLRQ